jgi:thymidylate synthase
MLPDELKPFANEQTYLTALEKVLLNGEKKGDRTGTGTMSVFGMHSTYDMDCDFPVLTSKKIFWKGIVGELLWFLRGETNIKSLQEDNINFWDEWADADGNLGPVYGYQWRRFPRVDWDNGDPAQAGYVDQIEQVRNSLINDPHSRRQIVSAWNPGMVHDMALPPCHAFFQFYVRENKYLDCQLYQRSADMFLGVPFNIASYSLLTAIMAMKVGLEPGRFHHTLGDAHIYVNHEEQVREQLYKRARHHAPKLWIDPVVKDLPWEELKLEHFKLVDYVSEGILKAEIAV